MPNTIKYSLTSQSLALKKGNYYIGTNDVGKGPTSSTGYWNGITPPRGGYTIYLNKDTNGPAIYTVANDSELITITNRIAGTSYTTVAQCLSYFVVQTDKMVFNMDYEAIVTNGLNLCLDAGFRPSYPTTNNTWYDISQTNNGTLTNGPTFSSTNGGSIVFDGVDDYIDNVGTTSDFNYMFTTGTFSVSFWIKKPVNNTRYAIAGNTLTNAEKGFFIIVEYGISGFGNNCLRFQVTGNQLNYRLIAGTTNDNTLGTNWTHCTFTCQNPDKIGQWYINGVASTTTTRGTTSGNANQGTYYSGPATRTLNIGRANFTSTTIPLNGNIAQFSIYDRALSASEVLTNFRFGGQKAFTGCKTCKDIIDTFPQLAGYDGLYWVYPNGPNSEPYQVHCDMTTDGGGWMLVARSHPTTVNPNGKKWGWKGGSIGSINDFSQAYQLGWGEIWNGNSTFTSYMFGNQRTNFDNGWGPFIYKVAGITYSTFFNSDTQQYYTTSTIKSNTTVYGTSDYPGMQGAFGYTTTGTNNDVYYMRDCCGFAGYGGYATQMTTTYCGANFYYSGPWCGGSTNTGGIYNFGTYVSNGLTYGGTNQYMIMVK